MASGDLFSKDSEFHVGMADFIRRCLAGVAGPEPRRPRRATGTNRLQQKLFSRTARFEK
jgi:hypothetical protein